MAGIMRNGQAYASKVDIDDTTISSGKTWSSEKISKINVSDAKKVDAKPTYADGTITYVKDGSSYTTTNTKQWFYYLDNDALKQTIFIDGEELTIDGASVDFDEYVKKGNTFLTEKTTLGGQADITCWDDTIDGSTNNYCAMSYYLPNGDIRRIQQDNGSDNIWYCKFDHTANTWSTKKICTTSISDIAKTALSLNSSTAFSEGGITYNVTNGVCDLTLAGVTNSTCSSYQLSTTSFPIPENGLVTVPIINYENGEIVGMFYIDANYNSIPTCHIYKTGSRGFCSISYKVAES